MKIAKHWPGLPRMVVESPWGQSDPAGHSPDPWFQGTVLSRDPCQPQGPRLKAGTASTRLTRSSPTTRTSDCFQNFNLNQIPGLCSIYLWDKTKTIRNCNYKFLSKSALIGIHIPRKAALFSSLRNKTYSKISRRPPHSQTENRVNFKWNKSSSSPYIQPDSGISSWVQKQIKSQKTTELKSRCSFSAPNSKDLHISTLQDPHCKVRKVSATRSSEFCSWLFPNRPRVLPSKLTDSCAEWIHTHKNHQAATQWGAETTGHSVNFSEREWKLQHLETL